MLKKYKVPIFEVWLHINRPSEAYYFSMNDDPEREQLLRQEYEELVIRFEAFFEDFDAKMEKGGYPRTNDKYVNLRMLNAHIQGLAEVYRGQLETVRESSDVLGEEMLAELLKNYSIKAERHLEELTTYKELLV